jgi:FAD/FMN-containing dehydrogenase
MFENSPFQDRLIQRHDSAITAYSHDSVLSGTPDAVFRPKAIAEVQEIVRYCAETKIPITCCGARTSMTGSSVTDTGLLLSLENLTGIVDILPDQRLVSVRPGTILGEMQRAVEHEGFFYPPSPTSRHECTVGATIITNATGDTTFKYGTTRRYVQELTLVAADGSLKTVTRQNPPPIELKSTAGYFLTGEDIDLVIGSEGTLSIVVEAKLNVIVGVPKFMTVMVPFPNNDAALRFIAEHQKISGILPRTMEYIDTAAANIMRTHSSFPETPDDARAFVICQQEYSDDSEDNLIDAWFAALTTIYTQLQLPNLLNAVVVARNDTEQARIADWRHHIPAAISERHLQLQSMGGGKVGTDWWVPLARMPEMMAFAYAASDQLKIPYIAFGHLGNGHPHFNYLTQDSSEKNRARNLVLDCCRKAVSLGGGVAGEHGIGKIKRDLLSIQHSHDVIAKMRTIKRSWDPSRILAPGNIFL